ncbi:MaoC family dehydratase [Sporomusa acidovorans]|uniref:(R)-specific enoyl-CoA hydratase n=1 Tax=Sporomusa acidovorans (strain ATCC 49682 / DSM 3132 / Mol) TaxID=1123286 RepID=A0ABZ3J9K1_SPOA4|nr:MaoC family dehydratase [Sporomusa acidovorans]OZC16115.1 (R)-specific enoyl-CoA hydratase [Sporomusa acidovorans DSM 3132]SDD86360.1 3-hydroxybutyryl-CoA dehydratase [Sporomusa acidovorans]
MQGRTISTLNVGDFAEHAKTISESDVYLFAGITGDLNPAHVNAQVAAEGIFKERIAHGMLSAGLVSAVLGMQLPGPGTVYLSQTLKFTAPVRFGDTITARAEIIDRNVEKNRITLKTTCTNQNGKIVLDGEAIVMPPKA